MVKNNVSEIKAGERTQCPNCGHDQDGQNPTHCLSCGWPLSLKGETAQVSQKSHDEYKQLKSALLDLGTANYERVRCDLIETLGYDQFRDLQNSVFKEIGTIKFEKSQA